jgi:hypothetical protein
MGRVGTAVVCGVFVAVLAACGSSRSTRESRVVNRAVAAIGSGSVMHVVWEMPTGNTFVDLKTGARTPSLLRGELWTDSEAHRVHLVEGRSGRVGYEELLPQDAPRNPKAFPPDPAASLAAEWLGFRAFLKTAAAVYAGTVRGRRVDWLRFPSGAVINGRRDTRYVAVDAKSYEPILFRTSLTGKHTSTHFDERIVLDKAIPYSSADFKRMKPVRKARGHLRNGHWSDSGIYATVAHPPGTTVRAPWLTAGPTASGLKLNGVNPFHASKKIDGVMKTVPGIEIVYGPMLHGLIAGDLATTVDELPVRDQSTDWRDIPAGSIEVQVSKDSGFDENAAHPQGINKTATVWNGYLKKDGYYVALTTYKGMAALLALARALHPAGK